MRIGIDLLWVRVGICGGTESFIRNLLDGFAEYDRENEYVLFVAKDNQYSFTKYEKYKNMTLKECNVFCASAAKRIVWENLHLDREAGKENLDVMFIPVYSKPVTYGSKIPYISVIHDLQALHYPEYFSLKRRLFLKMIWWYACKSSKRVITISNYCKEDLIKHYPFVKNKIETIYDPVLTKHSEMKMEELEEKYQIVAEQYFYCVSSMLPHKNLDTIFKVMQKRKAKGMTMEKLVLSGVGGEEEKVRKIIQELGIEKLVVLTGFVSDAERDCLYENCRMFLFPSIFEGFGMPPIEAMRKGKNVVMTDKTCLKEVTEGKAIYVENPFDVEEWMKRIEQAKETQPKVEKFERYNPENIVAAYCKAFEVAVR